MAEAERIVFNRGVNFVLPAAIPTHLDRADEYSLGDVLVFEKKLRPLMPWRKDRLVFTDVNISELLKDQAEPLDIKESVESIFDNANSSRTFGVDAKVDAEIQYAVAHFGVDVQATENASMSVDFGKVDRHFTNLSSILAQQSGKISVSMTHPVIQDALKHSSTLFVITSLYVAEKAVVNLSYTAGGKDAAKDHIQPKSQTTNPPPPASGQPATGQPPPTQPPTTTQPPATTPSTTPAVAAPEGPGVDLDVSFTSTGKSGMSYLHTTC